MKRISILIVALTLIGFTAVMAMPKGFEKGPNKMAFVFAVGYQDAMQIDAGLAIPIRGNVYGFVSAMGGDYGFGLGGRAAYLFTMDNLSSFWVGLALGPESEWHNIPDDGLGPINYITGAGGVLLGYSFEGWSLFGFLERNFPLDKNENVKPNYTIYGAVAIDL